METPVLKRFVDPNNVVGHFHFRPGDRVADFGAGTGYFVKVLAGAVGSEGRVYACEIQKTLVDKIGTQMREAHISNVEPIWCDLEAPEGTKLADGVLDGAVLVNTLFQIENKEAAVREMARTLRKGGKLFVIDWTESFGSMGPQPGSVFDETAARALFEREGFTFDRNFETGDHHYGIALRRV